jgi:hypothetical protein
LLIATIEGTSEPRLGSNRTDDQDTPSLHPQR